MTHDHDGPHEHDLGLSHDLPALLNRRRALGLLTGAGLAAALAACSGNDDSSGASATTSTPSTSPSTSGTTTKTVQGEVPEETGGPFPADGSNGINVLTESGVVRSDIRSSFGGTSTTAEGVTTTIELTIFDMNGSDVTPYEGAAVYLWHCDRAGSYSMYDGDAVDENYLRGVQEAADHVICGKKPKPK